MPGGTVIVQQGGAPKWSDEDRAIMYGEWWTDGFIH